METSDVKEAAIMNGNVQYKDSPTRPPRRQRPYTLRACISNFIRDLRYWVSYRVGR